VVSRYVKVLSETGSVIGQLFIKIFCPSRSLREKNIEFKIQRRYAEIEKLQVRRDKG